MNWVKLGLAVTALAVASAQEQTGLDLNSQGVEASSRGEHAEAMRFLEKAIEIWRGMGPKYEAHLAITQTNLAQTLSALGKRREASVVFEASLAEFRHSLGPENIHTLMAQNLLAANLIMLGDDMHAAPLLESAVAIERRLYPNDVQLSRSLSGQSLLNMRAGKIQEALPLAEESMTIALKADGDSGLDAALAYSNVAEAHRMAGRPERALPLYRKARAIYEGLLGPEHPRVASVLSQEGLILMEDGKLSLADKTMTQALAILSRNCPDCMFEHVVAETNLGLLRLKQGKYQEADRLLSHAIAVQERYGSQPGPMMAGTLHALAQVREKERRHDDAARLQKRAELILSFQ